MRMDGGKVLGSRCLGLDMVERRSGPGVSRDVFSDIRYVEDGFCPNVLLYRGRGVM